MTQPSLLDWQPPPPRICSLNDCKKPVLARGLCNSHYKRWWRHGDPLSGFASHGESEIWLENHKNFVGEECLIWPFGRSHGYGYINGKDECRVHRIMCEHRHGPPPTAKHDAAHSCGNGHLGCVNPQHLRWATRKENHADKLIHGTHNRGENNHRAKLTEAQVLEIRAAVKTPQVELAQRFGVKQSTISAIVNRSRWASL